MPTFTRSALPVTLSEFLNAYPKVDVKVTEAYSGVLEDIHHDAIQCVLDLQGTIARPNNT